MPVKGKEGKRAIAFWLPVDLADDVSLMLAVLRRTTGRRVTLADYFGELAKDDIRDRLAPGTAEYQTLSLAERTERHISELSRDNPDM